MTTKPNLLQQARGGDPTAVAALMNQSLNPKGIQAKAAARGDRLFIRLESQTPPDQTLLTKFVQSGIQNLSPAQYKAVEVSGKAVDGDRPAWKSVIDLVQHSISSQSPQSAPKPGATVPRPAPPPPPPPPLETELASSRTESPASEEAEAESELPRTRLQRDTHIPEKQPEEQQGSSDNPDNPLESSSQAEHDFLDDDSNDRADWNEDESEVYDADPEDGDFQDESFDAELDAKRQTRSLIPAEIPGPIDFSNPSSSKSSAVSGIVFVCVLLILLGATGGLIGYALWSYMNAGGSINDPGLTLPPVESAEEGESETGAAESESDAEPQMPPAELLQEASEKADSAATLAQTAQSGDDWNLVASQWQRALTSLESIPEGSAEYGEAQQRIATYRSQLTNAQQQASSLSNAASAPLPSTVVATNRPTECEAIAPGNNTQPLQLSDVRFDGSGGDGARPIAGCVTNNSELAIASATIAYANPAEAASEETPEGESETPATVTTEIQFSNLEPGATVPFTASLQVPAEVTGLQITTITWTPAGASEPQSLDVSIPLSAE